MTDKYWGLTDSTSSTSNDWWDIKVSNYYNTSEDSLREVIREEVQKELAKYPFFKILEPSKEKEENEEKAN